MVYWIWLQKVLGFGSNGISKIIEYYKTPKALYEANIDEIKHLNLLSPSALKRYSTVTLAECEATINVCMALKISIITPENKRYPRILLNTEDYPAVLYVKGKLPDFDEVPTFCIIGPRNCTEFGKKSAFSLSYRLARGGMTIISGGAVGADFYAHIGAIKAKGITVVVMPCGLDVNYPAANHKMREAVLQRGCLLSEFPPGYGVTKGAFLLRNRIMSGLSLGVGVVEAGERSGCLITANHAAQQGRDVFVVPGRTKGSVQYLGSAKLLEDGAKPLLSAVNIFEQYYGAFPGKIDMRRAYNIENKIISRDFQDVFGDFFAKVTKVFSKSQKGETALPKKPDISVLSEVSREIYLLFGDQEISIDDLTLPTVSDADMFTALSELELYGFIDALPGGRFIKLI